MAIIKERCRGDPKKIIVDVLTDWLQGKGVVVSWENLVRILRDCNISLLAKQIEMAYRGSLGFFFCIYIIS